MTALAAEYRQWLADGAHMSGRVDPIDATDAAYECEHGRLAFDAHRDPACFCWTAEKPPAPTPDLMTAFKEAKMTATKPKARVKGTSKAPAKATSLLAKVLDDLDAEIARLQTARTAVAKVMSA